MVIEDLMTARRKLLTQMMRCALLSCPGDAAKPETAAHRRATCARDVPSAGNSRLGFQCTMHAGARTHVLWLSRLRQPLRAEKLP